MPPPHPYATPPPRRPRPFAPLAAVLTHAELGGGVVARRGGAQRGAVAHGRVLVAAQALLRGRAPRGRHRVAVARRRRVFNQRTSAG